MEDEKVLLDKIKEQNKSQFDEFKNSLGSMASKNDIDSLVAKAEENSKITSKELAELKEIAKTQGEFLASLKNGQSKKEENLEDIIAAKGDQLKGLVDKRGHVNFEVKATAARSIITGSYEALRVPELGKLQVRDAFIEQLFAGSPFGVNQGGSIRYVDQTARTSNAAAIAEGASYPEDAQTWQEYSLPIEKVGSTIPITEEMLSDYGRIASEIQNDLMSDVNLKVDSYLIRGTGSTPQIFGIQTKATAFSAGTKKVKNANIYDLVMYIKAQIETATNYSVNYVLMHPMDVLSMITHKDDFGNYLRNPFVSPDGMNIAGIRVIANSGITENTLVMGDFLRGTVYTQGGIDLAIGYNLTGDFAKDILTIKARRRIALLVRTVNVGAFRYISSITDALAAIDSGA